MTRSVTWGSMGKIKWLFKKRKRRSKSLDDLMPALQPQTASIFQMKRQLQMKCNSFAEYSKQKMKWLKKRRSSESIRAVHSNENITISDSDSEDEVRCRVVISQRTSSRHIELHLNNDIMRLRIVVIMFFFTLLYVIFVVPLLFLGWTDHDYTL